MKKLALAVSAAAMLAVPAAPASAAAGPEIPEINCGIVSCTYVLEQRVEWVREKVAAVADCATGTVGATIAALNGLPQPYDCSL
jgi:acid phosphatase class B